MYAPLVQVLDDIALRKAKAATHLVKGDVALLLKASNARDRDLQDFRYFTNRQ